MKKTQKGGFSGVKTFEEFIFGETIRTNINESLKDRLSQVLKRGATFAADVWNGIKRESRETKEAVRLLSKAAQGQEITDTQKAFIRAQSVDLVKILPLVAIQGIPLPIPITPFLLLLGKKIGYNFLPDSHKKVDYDF